MALASPRPMGVGIVAVMLMGAACSANLPAARPSGAVVRVSERDFHISAPDQLSAGDVVLSVTNRGPEAHELIVVRSTDSQLPLRADAVTVDEKALAAAKTGALEPAQAGSVRTLRVHLASGRYVLFCNMAGHYMGGMQAVVVVP